MSEMFACHVFAHDGGRYQTVTALGVAAADTTALEQFFFGQTNDHGYLASLTAEPGIIWRRLSNGAALTRVRNGNPDADGRATLRFETLLIPPNRLRDVAGQIAEIALGKWNFLPDGATVSPACSKDSGGIHPDRVSDVAMAVRSGKRVAQRADAFSLRDVNKIVSACMDDSTFTLCFKSLNRTAPVSVNLVSLNITERKMASPKLPPPGRLGARSRPERRARASSQTDVLMFCAVCVALLVQILMFWSMRANPAEPSQLSGDAQNVIQHKIEVTASDTDAAIQAVETHMDSRFGALTKTVELKLTRMERRLEDVHGADAKQRETVKDEIEEEIKGLASAFNEVKNHQLTLKRAVDEVKKNLDSLGLEGRIDGLVTKLDAQAATLGALQKGIKALQSLLPQPETDGVGKPGK